MNKEKPMVTVRFSVTATAIFEDTMDISEDEYNELKELVDKEPQEIYEAIEEHSAITPFFEDFNVDDFNKIEV